MFSPLCEVLKFSPSLQLYVISVVISYFLDGESEAYI